MVCPHFPHFPVTPPVKSYSFSETQRRDVMDHATPKLQIAA
jgi:hypothetical protein